MDNKTIENIKNYHGFTTKQAKEYFKTASKEAIYNINNFYNIQSKKSFYED